MPEIVLVGQSRNADDKNIIALFRFKSNGTTDASFGTNGVTLTAFTTESSNIGDRLGDAIVQPDGKTDIAVFRDGTWYILSSQTNQVRYQSFGLASDALTPTDFDGDGKTDVAVWRDGVYYILQSSDSQITYQYFGSPGDTPIASAYVQ